MHGQQNIKISI